MPVTEQLVSILKLLFVSVPAFTVSYAQSVLRGFSARTGIPIVVIAALILVVVLRLFRKSARLVLEFTVALAVIVIATKLGWIAL